MSIDRDFDELRDAFLYALEDSGVSAEAEFAYLRGEGPDPWPAYTASDPRAQAVYALLTEWPKS